MTGKCCLARRFPTQLRMKQSLLGQLDGQSSGKFLMAGHRGMNVIHQQKVAQNAVRRFLFQECMRINNGRSRFGGDGREDLFNFRDRPERADVVIASRNESRAGGFPFSDRFAAFAEFIPSEGMSRIALQCLLQ